MIGTWRWNAIGATALAALIFLLSVGSNPLATAGIRTGIAFAVTFAVLFAIRWMLGQALASNAATASQEAEAAAASEEAGKGQRFDAVTPDDVPADNAELELEFTPLAPPKFAKTDTPIDPELLAQALRHMSDK
jgi:hypothetical protein